MYRIYIFSISAGAYYPIWKKSTSLAHWQPGGECKMELRYFYYISLCYIDSIIIVITVLLYIIAVALVLVAYFSIVMPWQDICRI
jgi:hypothetical protein